VTPIDPDVAAQVRAALGLRESDPDPPGGLVAAACLQDAAATRADAGAVLLIAVAMVRRARDAGATLQGARAAVGQAGWPLATVADVADLTAALVAMAAAHMDGDDLDRAAAIAEGLP
jgi:hypothetical protein